MRAMVQEAALVLLSCQALPSRRTDLLTRRVQPMRTPSTMLGRCHEIQQLQLQLQDASNAATKLRRETDDYRGEEPVADPADDWGDYLAPRTSPDSRRRQKLRHPAALWAGAELPKKKPPGGEPSG